jgi:hypothetical protein
MRKSLALLSSALLAGCATTAGGPGAPPAAGGVEYRQPEAVSESKFSKTVNKPLDTAWRALSAGVEKSPFLLQNANSQGATMTLRFSGDPEPYVDCGRIVSEAKNAKGKRKYDFPASSARQQYEIVGKKGLYAVDRRMTLEAKIQVALNEVGPAKTRARAKAYYTLTKTILVRRVGALAGDTTRDKVEFDSAGAGVFQVGGKDGTVCRATGKLEAEALALVK